MRRNIELSATLALLTIATTVCAAQPASAPAEAVRSVWAGISGCAYAQARIADPGSPTETKRRGCTDVIHVEETSVIPARLGLSFSVRYKWLTPHAHPIPHTLVWRFPGPGIRNPNTGTVFTEYRQSVADHNCSGEFVCRATWNFSEPWELVPGTWSLDIIEAGKQTRIQTFTVVRP